MNIRIKGNGLEVTEAIRSYIEKKFAFLTKFIQGDFVCDVEVSKTNEKTENDNVFRVEINIRSKDIFVVSEKPDLYEAVDDVKDEVERVLVSKKEKRITLFRRGALRVKNILKGLYDYPVNNIRDRVRRFRNK
jgi:putative sigma-54 modulation protein